MTPMFDDQLRDLVIQAASRADGLTEEQRQRVGETLTQFLNQPPVFPRLEAALRELGLTLGPSEFDALRRVRKPRTQAQHGQPWDDVSQEDREIALACTARVVAHWGNQLRSTQADIPR
jgi:hypothetical protein